MDQFLYKCHYCGKEYEPRRRHKQKYCSNSCRVTAFKLQKEKNVPGKGEVAPQDQNVKKESMSLAGIGNATAGNVLYDMIKNFLTSEENKSASNGQAKEILQLLTELKERERHHLITNTVQGGRGPSLF